MRYTVPDYYKKFVCLAGECPATCCAGWQIVIDEKSLKKYAKAQGSVGNHIRNGVDFKESVFLQYGKRCAFLNDENLCDMHIEAGTDMMCNTCRKYPRHIEVFDNEREITLSMSCPAVAQMILGQEGKTSWKVAEDDKEDAVDEEFDDFLYSALCDTRTLMIEMLQDRTISVHLRMAEVLALAHDVQNRVNARQIFDVQNVLERYKKEGAKARLLNKLQQEKAEDPTCLLSLLDELETLEEGWKERVHALAESVLAESVLAQGELAKDAGAEETGTSRIETTRSGELEKGTNETGTARSETVDGTEKISGFDAGFKQETEAEQMMIYYLFTYFCGAVYDGDLLAKTKMAIVSSLIWEVLCQKQAQLKGEELSFYERCELAWSYSRELEHSDPNLNKMEELMNEREEADFIKMLGYLV